MAAAYSLITTSFAMENNSSSLKSSGVNMSNATDGQHSEGTDSGYKVYVSVFIAVLAIILNCLSMLATLNIPGKLTSHLKFILSLSLSDMLFPLATTSSSIHMAIMPGNSINQPEQIYSHCTEMVIGLMMCVSLLATQFILVAMAFDHYIAINLPLYYTNMCSKGNANAVILLVWFAASAISLTNVIIGMNDFYHKKPGDFNNFCHYAVRDEYYAEFIIYVATIISSVVIMAINGKIFCDVKNLSSERNEPRQRNWVQNKKALMTTLLIVGSFFLFYLPHCFYQIGLIIKRKTDPAYVNEMYDTLLEIQHWLYWLQVLNSVCDPIIYALRLQEVQRGYKRMRHKLRSLIVCSQYHHYQFSGHYRFSYESTSSSRSRTASAISEDRGQNQRSSLTNSQCIRLESYKRRNTIENPTMLHNQGDAELGVTDVVPDAISK